MWFKSGEGDEMTDFITAKIFGSGTYGTAQGHLNAEAVRTQNTGKHVKGKKIFSLIFPSYKGMREKYTILKKAPILLPFMWVVRWIEMIFHPSKIKAQKKRLDMLNAEGVNKYQSELDYVGLKYYVE